MHLSVLHKRTCNRCNADCISLWVSADMYKQQPVQDANELEYLGCTWDASLGHKENTCHRRNGPSLRKMTGIGNGKLLGYRCLSSLPAIFSNCIMHVLTGKPTLLHRTAMLHSRGFATVL